MPFRCRVVSRGAEDEDVDEEGGEVDEEGAVEEEASVAGSVLGGSTLGMLETTCVEIWRLTTAPGFFLAAGWMTVVVDHGRYGGWQ